MTHGIEAINAYVGRACVGVRDIFEARGLETQRFENLMMQEKSLGAPWEDAVTFAVNAAKPIIDKLSQGERDQIEMVITASESGIDFGKSISTYVHDHLGLSRNCRLFEVKQACYGATASLQMALSHLMAQAPEGAKALVIATDVARATARNSYAEPSQAVASVAILVGDQPKVMATDKGAYGLCGYEVMDTCRPAADLETGDPDLSLLSYLECLETAFANYCAKVSVDDHLGEFSALVMHTPFAGLVKGAHRNLLRSQGRKSQDEIAADFEQRVLPSLQYAMRNGNAYSASLYLALISLIDNFALPSPKRIGLFSYGSGCASEFFSGVVLPTAKDNCGNVSTQLDQRKKLDIAGYDDLVDACESWGMGIRDKAMSFDGFGGLFDSHFKGRELLVLNGINDFHREYQWS